MTGVIYLAIIAMWAVVLVPMWLRRHEENEGIRSAANYRKALSTLSDRSTPAPRNAARARTTPRVTVAGQPDAVARVARIQAAARRRRVLGLLCVVTLGFGAAALRGLVPVWASLIPVGLIVVFVAVSVRTVRQQRQRRPARPAAQRLPAVAHSAAPRRGGRSVEPPVRLTLEQPSTPRHAAAGWSPRTTAWPPTVTGQGSRVPRVIDLTTPGTWAEDGDWDSGLMLRLAAQARTGGSNATAGVGSQPAATDQVDLRTPPDLPDPRRARSVTANAEDRDDDTDYVPVARVVGG